MKNYGRTCCQPPPAEVEVLISLLTAKPPIMISAFPRLPTAAAWKGKNKETKEWSVNWTSTRMDKSTISAMKQTSSQQKPNWIAWTTNYTNRFAFLLHFVIRVPQILVFVPFASFLPNKVLYKNNIFLEQTLLARLDGFWLEIKVNFQELLTSFS